ncbi:MAG: hypothetical protein LBM63_04525 [Rikenellaceae bacterium]|jgi:hypothetical protein|nr:hypothetical protein [Rikenellaceae bacterium]
MIDNKRRLPAWVKAVIATGSVLLFLLIIMLGAEAWARHKIRTTIEKEAIAVAGTPVTVRIGRIGVSLTGRSISIRNITLHSQNNDPVKADSAVIVSLDGVVEQISFRGIGYRKTGGKPALSAYEVVIDTPQGTLVTRAIEKHRSEGEKKDFRQTVTERLNSVVVGRIEIHDAGVEYVRWISDNDERRFKLTGGKLTANDFRIDSTAAADRILFCKNIELHVTSARYGYGAGTMVAEADTLSASSAGALSMAALRLVPQFAKDEYAQKSKGHKDWTRVEVSDVQGWGVDFRRMIAGEIVAADSISIAGAEIGNYKNKQVYREPVNKPLLWQSLQNLPITLDINKIDFTDVAFRYDELSETGTTPGTVRFSGGKGEMLNVTNIAEGHDPYFTVRVSALLMDSGQLDATFNFPVSPALDHFRVTGTLGKSNMSSFNSALTPLINIRVDSGVMNGLSFELDGTQTSSHIEMTMLYDGLSVSLLKSRDHSRERDFLTLVANDMLIRNANPTADGRVRTASGHYTRDPHRSTFNYIWKSFVPAITKTVL